MPFRSLLRIAACDDSTIAPSRRVGVCGVGTARDVAGDMETPITRPATACTVREMGISAPSFYPFRRRVAKHALRRGVPGREANRRMIIPADRQGEADKTLAGSGPVKGYGLRDRPAAKRSRAHPDSLDLLTCSRRVGSGGGRLEGRPRASEPTQAAIVESSDDAATRDLTRIITSSNRAAEECRGKRKHRTA
jgi:hypothetical protein